MMTRLRMGSIVWGVALTFFVAMMPLSAEAQRRGGGGRGGGVGRPAGGLGGGGGFANRGPAGSGSISPGGLGGGGRVVTQGPAGSGSISRGPGPGVPGGGGQRPVGPPQGAPGRPVQPRFAGQPGPPPGGPVRPFPGPAPGPGYRPPPRPVPRPPVGPPPYWDAWHDAGTAFAVGAGIAAGAAVIGSFINAASYSALPCTTTTVYVDGVTYYRCGPNWYTRGYRGGEVVYVVVAPPPGY